MINIENQGTELLNGIEEIIGLINEINMKALPSNVRALISCMLLRHDQSLASNNIVISNAIKMLNNSKSVNVAEMVETSYEQYEEDENSLKAQREVGVKCNDLYNSIKASIPSSLVPVLFALDNAYGEQFGLISNQYYTAGYTDAMKAFAQK